MSITFKTEKSSDIIIRPSKKTPEVDSTTQKTEQIAQLKKNDFSSPVRVELLKGWQGTLCVLNRYLKKIHLKNKEIVQSFDGVSLSGRHDGMQTLMQIRKEMAIELFQTVVRPQVEALMRQHGDHRSFEEAATVFGFNRLFTREIASAGTDIDFMLAIDTKDEQLIKEIQFFIKEIVRPKMRHMGVDMEAADYLMGNLDTYLPKLDITRKSLFTLANVNNIHFIAGSKKITEQMFSFTDKQLVEHFGNLINNIHPILKLSEFKENLLSQLIKQGPSFRQELIRHLRKMANSELYIGKKPYDNKKTVQTVFAKDGLKDKIKKRTEKFSIKYCLNRIVDIHAAAKISPSGDILTQQRLQTIEQLALVLSNIACRLDTPESTHPALRLQEGYSDISLEQMSKMTSEDRKLVAELLNALGVIVHPESTRFAEALYDSLWVIGEILCKGAQQLEEEIADTAYAFATAKK